MQKILLATRNKKKLHELQSILAADLLSLQLITIDDILQDLPEVIENGDTFEANAIKKASVLAKASGLLTLADDSGLCVDALGGAPGVYSARFAGEPSNDARNNQLLLQKLEGISDRSAHFVCVIALANPDGDVATVSGSCGGYIIEELKGVAGFGYDPLFVANGTTLTFAEISAAEKQKISHRARALAQAKKQWFQQGSISWK